LLNCNNINIDLGRLLASFLTLPTTNSPLNFSQQIRFTSLKLLMKKANITSLHGIIIIRQDGLILELTKAIKVELSGKGCEVGMFEILGQDF